MDTPHQIPDSELLARTRQGDRSAYRILFERYYAELCRQAAYRLNGDEDSAQDVVQQVFIDFWVQRKNEVVKDNVKGYLARMMQYKAASHVRNEVRKRANQDKWAEQTRPGEATGNDNAGEPSDELLYALRNEIQQLPPQCRAVFVAAYLEEQTYDQVAAQLGISRNSVKTQMKIAMAKLRARLGNQLPLFLFTLIHLLKRL